MNAVLLKDAPGSQLTQGHVCLSSDGYGVTSQHWQASVINDPAQRGVVAAAIKGEILPTGIEPQAWVEREMGVSAELAKLGLAPFDQKLVERAAEMGVGLYDRFVPNGLRRRQLLEASGKLVKLYQGSVEAADQKGDEMPTETGLFSLDYRSIFMPTNDEHHPFMFNYDQHWSWATAQGGQGFSTAEEALYVAVLRPRIELGYLPYMGGAIRCQNPYGSGNSLYVYFNADDGLYVDCCSRSNQSWDLWALPRKYWALGS